MSLLNQLKVSNQKVKSIVVILAVALIILPSFAISSHHTKLYVNDGATGTQDGSSSHPFKTIGQAMDVADKNTEIHVANGFYKENVKIKSDIEIYGESKKGVIIEAKDNNDPVIRMANDTVINKVTLQKGHDGVRVNDDAKASIVDCVIKSNKRDGIFVEADGGRKERRVSISDNEIIDNDAAGIYAGKRSLSIVGNNISDNDDDGIDIGKGSRAWIADNRINGNDKSGMKLRIDDSIIWTKNNSIRKNNGEGIEVSFGGVAGRIDVAKSRIMENDRYGVARVQRTYIANSANLWNQYLTFDNKNTVTENKLGTISDIVVVK